MRGTRKATGLATQGSEEHLMLTDLRIGAEVEFQLNHVIKSPVILE